MRPFRDTDFNYLSAIGAISHSAFKGRWLSSFSREDQKTIHQRFVEAVSKKASTESNVSIVENNGFEFGFPDETIEEFRPSLSQGEVTSEVTRYLKNTDYKLSSLENFPTIKKNLFKIQYASAIFCFH